MDSARRVRFGAFEADLSTGELRKHGIPVRLQEQPSKILAALLEHLGEVVSREDLIKLLWPDGTFVDYDRGLNAAINRLRQALSDSAENPRYVETVARRGYRFIAPVETGQAGAELASPTLARKPAQRWAWIVVGGLAALAAGILLLRSREAATPPLEPIPLTTYEGGEQSPSFSPDGTQLVFEWNGPKQDNIDIYVMTVGGGPPRRLTSSPVPERLPAWSPDGRFVAFRRGREGIYVVSPNGGAERKLFSSRSILSPPSWSADSKHVAFALPAAGPERAGIFAVAWKEAPPVG